MKQLFIVPLLLAATVLQAEVVCKYGNENTAVPETTPTADFIDNGDGTVLHKTTGLVWMRCAIGRIWDGSSCSGGALYSWQGALKEARDINTGASDTDGDGAPGYAGHTDWRLPNTKELESILEERCWNPKVNAAIFPGVGQYEWYWTSSAVSKYPDRAWYLDFDRGFLWDEYRGLYNFGLGIVKEWELVARLVRGGQ